MRTVRDFDFNGKTVLVRVDYNVPLENGVVTDDLRVRASVPTIQYLRENGAKKIVLISHLGRPEGVDESLSLAPVAKVLDGLVGQAYFVPAVAGDEVASAVEAMKDGDVLLLENLRFFPGEEANDAEYIKGIIDAVGAEVYVQDGFAVVHRAHASTDAVAQFLPVVAGLLLEKEIVNLRKVMDAPEKPFLMIVGGSKVEDKAPLIDKFVNIADNIVVGGKIAADGYDAGEHADKIYVAEDFDEDGAGAKLDVGPVSTGKIAEYINGAKTIIWNGLMGKAEDPAYATASTIVAELVGENTEATTVICGGDTTGFVENLMESHPGLSYTLISTGGGAALEFLLGKELPGIKVVQ